jgi:hypothetical protein
MSWMKRTSLGLVVGSFALAAILGASLGVAVAKHSTTVTGVCPNGSPGCNTNNFVGTIRSGSVSPSSFTSCIPAGTWEAIYIWDGPTQEWRHFFNTTKFPAYINASQAGGIDQIPGFAGVVLIMTAGTPATSITLLDSNSETCN